MDDRSERNLVGVHPDLVKVIRASYADWTATGGNFIVTEGLRTLERQQQLYKSGASHTMNSRHLTGHAADLACKVGDSVRWDWPLYYRLGAVMKSNARRLGVALVWGGDWTNFKDGPHYELDRGEYP
jgi:peptidoglycan L-alanyl-D-glutamate endopeptidase CwlK